MVNKTFRSIIIKINFRKIEAHIEKVLVLLMISTYFLILKALNIKNKQQPF